MKYHIYIEDEEAGDIAERLNPASEGVGYLVEDRFEAKNFEGATTITQEWIAQRILSRPRDPVTVFIAELETGEHRQLKVTLPSTKPHNRSRQRRNDRMLPKALRAPGQPARGMPQASLLQRSRGFTDLAGRSSQGRHALKPVGRVWPETQRAISVDPAGTAVIAEKTFRSVSDPLCKPLGSKAFVEKLQASLPMPATVDAIAQGPIQREATMTLACLLLFALLQSLFILTLRDAEQVTPQTRPKAHWESLGNGSIVRMRPDSTTATQCPTRSEKLSRERLQSLVMKGSSRIENKATGPSSDKWSMERELSLRALLNGGRPKMATFTERRRTSWKSFMWPRPCSPLRLKP
jgi:hypothetical protein